MPSRFPTSLLLTAAVLLCRCASMPDQTPLPPVAKAATPAAWSEYLTADEVDRVQQIKTGAAKPTKADAALLAKSDRVMAQATARSADAQATVDRQRAASADCVYQAQMANVTTPGIVNGLLAGLAAGSVCNGYYRNTGVLPP